MKRLTLALLVLSALIPSTPSTADGQQTITVTPPRDPRLNQLASVASKDKVNVTWKSSHPAALTTYRYHNDPLGFGSINTGELIPAQGENTFEATVGQAFRLYEQKEGGRVFQFMVPDGKFEHPDDKKFEATQTIDVPPTGSYAFTYDVPGRGYFDCMNRRGAGYGSVWTFTYQKNDQKYVDHYVQVVVGTDYLVLRNLANRHTVRLYHKGRGEEATPGVKEWKPLVDGGWSK